MAYIETVADDAATGEAAKLYAEHVAARGYVPNYLRLLALRPDVYAAWRGLVKSITAELDLRRYELVTLAAARALRSTYCATEHGKVLRDRFYDADSLRRIASDHTNAGLAPVDTAIMDFAEKVARDAASVCFFSTVLHAMGVGPDAVTLLGLEAPLRASHRPGGKPDLLAPTRYSAKVL